MYLIQCASDDYTNTITIGYTTRNPDCVVAELQAWWDSEWRDTYKAAIEAWDIAHEAYLGDTDQSEAAGNAIEEIRATLKGYDAEVVKVLGVKPDTSLYGKVDFIYQLARPVLLPLPAKP